MPPAKIRQAQPPDATDLAAMRNLLWAESSVEEHRAEVENIIQSGMNGSLPMAILVAISEDEALIGFLEAGMRSHADGCDEAQPVGYVEGWFVREEFRNRGVGTELMRAAEDWARAQGCSELASDALIDNLESERAHVALGFAIVDRCVHFRKPL